MQASVKLSAAAQGIPVGIKPLKLTLVGAFLIYKDLDTILPRALSSIFYSLFMLDIGHKCLANQVYCLADARGFRAKIS